MGSGWDKNEPRYHFLFLPKMKRCRSSSGETHAEPQVLLSSDGPPPQQIGSSRLPMQALQHRGAHDSIVLDSPYGSQRSSRFGWGHLFSPPLMATVPGHPNIYIGISSLNGVPTVGKSDRTMRSLLRRYATKFRCLEHCYPYHRMADLSAWQAWAAMAREVRSSSSSDDGERTPFVYTIKANKYLTHERQLLLPPENSEMRQLLVDFFAERCAALGPHLGPVLLQLPPSFHYSEENMRRLTELQVWLSTLNPSPPQVHAEPRPRWQLPSSSFSAEGGSTANSSVEESSPGGVRPRPALQIAVEFRHRSWHRAETFELLRKHRWSLVVSHHHNDSTFSSFVDTGSSFLYMRLHGPLGPYMGDYGPLMMRLWAEEIVAFLSTASPSSPAGPKQEREVFVFLNNSDSHVGGLTSSTVDATCLAEQLRTMLKASGDLG